MKLIGFILLGLIVINNPGYAKSTQKKELKIGITQEFECLNQLIAQMSATAYIYGFVGRKMVNMDPSGNYYADLVKHYPTLKNGLARIKVQGDAKHIEADWEIKENALWGDGKPVTGHDVKFSWQVALNPKVAVGETETYDQVKDIVVDPKNPKKFTFIYRRADWNFNQLGTFYVIPKHIEEPIYNKHKDTLGAYEKNTEYVNNPTNKALYSGPYVISELKLGSHVILSKNPKFFGKPASIDKIIIKLIPSTGTLEANLRSGVIDMISVLGLTFDQALAFDKKVKSEKLPFNVNFRQSMVYEHVDLQLKNEILQDITVRKALVHAINRKDLTNAIFEGKQLPAVHNIATIDEWYTDDPKKIVIYNFSRRKARKLLETAGWKIGKDGYRYKNNKKLSFQLMTTAGNKTRELVEGYLQDQWKKVGIHITIKNEPPRVYFGETVRKSKFPAMAMFAWVSSPQNPPRSTLHSQNIPTEKNGFSGQNSPNWRNKEVDTLLDAVRTEFNAAKRKEIIHKILWHYTNEVPVIPLYYRSNISVVPKSLSGYKLVGHQFHASYHSEHWRFD